MSRKKQLLDLLGKQRLDDGKDLSNLCCYAASSSRLLAYCLQPSAKDLGITRIVVDVDVVVVLFHLSHFLFKRNSGENNSPTFGIVARPFGIPA